METSRTMPSTAAEKQRRAEPHTEELDLDRRLQCMSNIICELLIENEKLRQASNKPQLP